MIDAVKNLIRELTEGSPATESMADDEALHMVSAAMMAEVMTSDGESGAQEKNQLKDILVSDFRLSPDIAESLIRRADSQVSRATSLFEFTDKVNRTFSNDEKFELIRHLWMIAYADGKLHKLEEATIRKVADLIYVPHSAFIRAKQLARDRD